MIRSTALDIRPLLGLMAGPPRAAAALLIVSANGLEVGLLADEVVEIRHGDTKLSPALSSAEVQAAAAGACLPGAGRPPPVCVRA